MTDIYEREARLESDMTDFMTAGSISVDIAKRRALYLMWSILIAIFKIGIGRPSISDEMMI